MSVNKKVIHRRQPTPPARDLHGSVDGAKGDHEKKQRDGDEGVPVDANLIIAHPAVMNRKHVRDVVCSDLRSAPCTSQ